MFLENLKHAGRDAMLGLRSRTVFVIYLLAAILFLSMPVFAQQKNTLKISGGSITKVGTSFHDWYCEAEPVLTLGDKGIASPIGGFTNGVADLSISVAVTALNCDGDDKAKVSKLEKNLQDALRAKESPSITFKMSKYILNNETAMVTGNLTIAGVTKEVNFNVKLTERGRNLLVKGETLVLMSDYGVKQVKALFGTIMTKDEVKTEFSVELAPIN